MAGTVRGTFDMNTRPASTALRRLRGDLDATDRRAERLGRTLDKIGTPAQIGRIETLSKTVGGLQGRLDALGRTRATPRIDLDGVAEALAQVELLERSLSRLDGRRVSPRLSAPVGAPAAAAAAVPRGIAQARGSARSPLSSLRLGPFGLTPATGLPLTAVGLPAAQALIGGAGGFAGSIAQGGLGAGAIGIGGAGALTGALSSIFSVAGPAASRITAANKAMQDLQAQVLLTGRSSAEAAAAQQAYNVALQGAPRGTRQMLRTRAQFVGNLRARTRPGARDLTAMGTSVFAAGNRLAPQLARQGNAFFGEARQQTDRFARFATGGTSRRFLGQMGAEATNDLAPLEHTAENLTATFANLAVTARPFFHDFLGFVDQWTGGWRRSSTDIEHNRKEMAQFVGQLKSAGHLTGATFDLLRDLLGAGAPAGQRGIDDLTKQLETWDRWVQRNPAKVEGFFQSTMTSTEQIAGFLGQMVGFANQLATVLGPVLTSLTQVTTLLSNTGLLSTGGLPLLLAGGAGVRAAGGMIRRGGAGAGVLGAGGGIGAGEAVLGGAMLGGGARGAARGFFGKGSTYQLARSFGRGRVASTVAEMGARGAGGAFLRGAGARFLPIAAVMGGLQAAGTPGGPLARAQAGLSGLTAGIVPAPKSNAQVMDEAAQMAVPRQNTIRGIKSQMHGIRSDLLKDPGSLSRLVELGGGAGALIKYNSDGTPDEATRAAAMRGFAKARTMSSGFKNESIQQAVASFGSLAAQKTAAVAQFQSQRSQRVIGDASQAFRIGTSSGMDPSKAFGEVSGGLMGRLRGLRGQSQREFGQMTVGWLQQMRKANPELKRETNHMMNQVVTSLRRGGQQVKLISGRIVDTSAGGYARVMKRLSTASEAMRASVTKDLTALQRQLVAILQNMGVARKSAVQIAQLGEPQNQATTRRQGRIQAGGGIPEIIPAGPHPRRPGRVGGRHGATGMRIPGKGLEDTVPVAPGAMAAPNELIVNRHTERRVNHLLGPAGTSLGREVGREGRELSQQIQAYDQKYLNDKGVPRGRRKFARGGRATGTSQGSQLDTWLTQGMQLAGHYQPAFLTPLRGRAMQESGGNPRAVNNWDSNAAAGHPSKGLLQTIDSTFAQYKVAGHDDIFNPVDNTAAAVRYMFDRYHHIVGPSGSGYARGGRVRAFARGGRTANAAAGQAALSASGTSDPISKIQAEANRIDGLGLTYSWGGSHGQSPTPQNGPFDCSSAVSHLLQVGGYGNPTMVSGQLATWGKSGRGPLTVYANSTHTFAEINGRFWGTSGENPGGGPGWHSARSAAGYATRVPAGGPAGAAPKQNGKRARMATGGRIAWGGWYAGGGSGVVTRPTMIGVGERGREHVEVRPHRGRVRGSHAGAGATHRHTHVHFDGPVSVRSDADIDRIADKVGDKLADAMRMEEETAV